MILGIGTDVVGLSRFEAVLGRTPTLRERLFTPAEAALPTRSLAARFAAKEAMVKALGAPGGLAWSDCEVVVGERGVPAYSLTGEVAARAVALGARRWHLSLSHPLTDGADVATAFCVLED